MAWRICACNVWPDSAEIRKSLGLETASDVAVFGEIRERKNNF